jgi:uncharacterized protein involved in response to NO
MSTASARRAYEGPALLSFGFRPFFLLGAAWAAVSIPLWVWSLLGGSAAVAHRAWHVHEMLFGFLAAVVAGFLTTAVPNWTGRMPVIGAPLGGLVLLWLAGRLAMLLQFLIGPVAAAVDVLFLLAFAAVVWREVLAGRNWRNLPVCGLVSALAIANVTFHLDPGVWTSGLGERLGLGAAVVLIALIGGRITPSFTLNGLTARRLGPAPAAFGALDRLALGATALGAAAWTLAPQAGATGLLLLLAGAANAARLARWRGWLAWREPLVWILHLGYGWLAAGLALLGAAVVLPQVAVSAGVHALTAGAIGTMTLAVMTRASRGHTGRPLAADGATLGIYLAILLAGAFRVAAPFSGGAMPAMLVVSAALWTAAFGGFALGYGPMLATPRRKAA